ncbi:GNAT family N-acetyltransferase [Streptomyces sp. NPDC059850]|uniref:GNAT family N-acetyltransferase n=1 Tax=Streptomyces sp. NPDC059850 TaxID=3346970 RepID=UPI00366840A0
MSRCLGMRRGAGRRFAIAVGGSGIETSLLARERAGEEAGRRYFHLLVGAEGEVLGRVTGAVRTMCDLAADSYGLSALQAETILDNVASRAALARTGFTVVGETRLDGRPGLTYRRDVRP